MNHPVVVAKSSDREGNIDHFYFIQLKRVYPYKGPFKYYISALGGGRGVSREADFCLPK